MENRIVALLFRVIATVQMVICIYCNVGFVTHGCFEPRKLIYFTIQSNIWLCAHFMILLFMTIYDLAKKGIKGYTNTPSVISGTINLCIFVTHFIYHWVLFPEFEKNGIKELDGIIIHSYIDYSAHYYSALLAILDYFFFTPKNTYKWYYPFCWSIVPYIYMVFIFILAPFIETIEGGSRYPYFFMDIDKFGVQKVVLMILGLTGIVLILEYILVLIDKIDYKDGKFVFGLKKEKEEGKKKD